MTIRQLMWKEITHRKLSFTLGLIAVVIAVACLTGALTLLRAHDLRTEQIIAHKEAATKAAMDSLADDYRKIMKQLGYNTLILSGAQQLDALYANGYATSYMPEAYAERLAAARVTTLNHLLPVLQQKMRWPEQGRDILLTGICGQLRVKGVTADKQAPIMQPVPKGGLDMGAEIARELHLTAGSTVTLLGESFTLHKVFRHKGTADDFGVWINLDRAQALLKQPGKINGILALECICAPDALAQITAEVARVLPDVQVFEFSALAATRAAARTRADTAGKKAIAEETTHRAALRRERESLASVAAPLTIAGCALWILLLFLGNVRERRTEIGILRAIGLRSGQLHLLFAGKAMLMGLLGAAIGYFAGLLVGSVWGEAPDFRHYPLQLFDPLLLLAMLTLAPVLAGLAGWLPAMLAAEQDPATALREE